MQESDILGSSHSVKGTGFWAKRSLAGLKDSRGKATESQPVPSSPHITLR